MFDYAKIRATALKGPRVTSLKQHFENIAAGLSQAPCQPIRAADDFLNQSDRHREYHTLFQHNIGTFYQHLCASIPFFIEEQCRLGIALYLFAQQHSSDHPEPFTLYETSSADGTNARTLAQYSQGKIRTLTDSPNIANGQNFHKLCQHDYSDMHIGPFVDITPEYLASRTDRPYLKHGFDVIYENTTFQMYNPDRRSQIAYVKRVLKEGGIIIFSEKLMHPNRHEYERREAIKNTLFKAQYFSQSDIDQKNKQILTEMEKCQVTLGELVASISHHFNYASMIWNSTNFYEIVASNNQATLEEFVNLLSPYHVPHPFLCEANPVRPLL